MPAVTHFVLRVAVDEARWWLRQLRTEDQLTIKELTLLVACKADLADQRQVSTEAGMKVAAEAGVAYMETSARTGENCSRLLPHLHQQIVELTEPRFVGAPALRPESSLSGSALALPLRGDDIVVREKKCCPCCAIM